MLTHQKIARAAGLIAFLSILSRLLGFVRDQVIAAKFGTTALTDAYLVAYSLPNLVYVIVVGALTAVFIPVFTGYLAKNDSQRGWKTASIIINLTALGLGLATLVGFIGAPFFVKLLAPRFDAETAALAAQLARIMFPGVIFMGLAGIFAAILNSYQHFALPALAPAVTNLAIIAGAYFLAGEWGIYSLAIGTLVGFMGQLLIQIPQVAKKGFRYSYSLNLTDEGVRKIGVLILPVAAAIGVSQIYITIDSILASGLAPGSLAALKFAFRLMQLPLGVFVMAISTAVFPTLALQAVQEDKDALRKTTTLGLTTIALLTVPAAIGLMALRVPIISLLFERGSFNTASTLATASALLFYAVGLFGHAGNAILTRVYYALKDTKTVVYTTLAAVSVNLVFSLIFIRIMGHSGLALANSLAALINLTLLVTILHYKIGGVINRRVGKGLGKILIAGILLGLTSSGTIQLLGSILDLGTILGKAIQVVAAITTGIVVYAGTLILLKSEEALYFVAWVKERFAKKGI